MTGRGPFYDFEGVKVRAARWIERTIEDGLKGEITVDEWNRVVDLLKHYDGYVVVHALIAAVAYKMAMETHGSAVPPFYYQGERKHCH